MRRACLRRLLMVPATLLALGAGLPATAQTESARIRIIGTNDIHSYMRPVYYRHLDEPRPWGEQSSDGDYAQKAGYEGPIGGVARVATLIKRLRTEMPGSTLLVDSGDAWHGAGLSVFDEGVSMIKVMNAIGYDAMVPGNWEFIYGREHLLGLIEQADFPVIAYNLTDKDWGDPVLDSYIVKQVGGLKIAIIGMTYPWTALTTAIRGSAQWWNFGIKETEAQELIDEIRSGENPDLVVFISHAGFGMDQKFAQRVDGIDVIVSGHTHNQVFDPVVWNGAIIFEGGALGKFVSSLDLEVKDKRVVNFDYRLIKVNQDIAADPEVAELVEAAYRPHAARLNEVIGRADGMFYRRDYWQSTLGNMVTDALRELAGTDIGFFPAWRYGATLMPGEITAEDIYNIEPTGGHIITYGMAGKDIKALLENIMDAIVNEDPYSRVGGDMIRFSGLQVVYDRANARGERLTQITLADGRPFLADKDYTVASVNTRFQDNPLFGAKNVVDTGKIFAEELIAYIRANSPVKAALDARIAARREAP